MVQEPARTGENSCGSQYLSNINKALSRRSLKNHPPWTHITIFDQERIDDGCKRFII